MARHGKIITLDQFKDLCKTKLGVGTDDFDIYELPDAIQKDIKIQFDYENYDLGNAEPSFKDYPTDHQGYNNYPVGYEVLPNGMPILFINAGGDWECPVCFCIYYDGKVLRAYVPTEGNVFNVKQKCAFGSEDEDEDEQEYPQGDPEKIRLDVMNRIKIE